MDPNWTREVLTLDEKFVIRIKMQRAPTHDAEVEYLVTSATKIKRTRLASLRDTQNVQNGSLNVQVAPKREPSYINWYFRRIHET